MAQTLADAAYKSWAAVKADPRRHDKVGTGAGGNPTSRADKVLEDAILAAAKDLKLSVLSEEAGLVDQGSRYLAVVDPLDGSRNAGRGIPFHCTSVAIGPAHPSGRLKDIEAGVVQNLVTGDIYTVARGKGSFANGVAVEPGTFDQGEVIVGMIADYASTEIEEAHARRGHHIRDLGSAALELCLVGTGAMDAFLVRKPWLRVIDIAAATLFCREAGGSVIDPATGRDLDMPLDMESRAGLIAANNPQALEAVRAPIVRRTPSGRMSTPFPADRPLTWALVGKGAVAHVRKEAQRLADHLESRGQKVLMETTLAVGTERAHKALTDLDAQADLFLTVGGDGTILMVQGLTEKPILGVNAGAIGFLCEVEPPQATAAIDQVIRGDYSVEEREKLSAWLGDERLPDACNEVTLQTSRIAKLIQFRITVSGEVLDTLRGDGIIVSTATGSTGYAMSVGGPLVHPLVSGTVLAPIAPFRLAARPWIVPADAQVELTLLERDSVADEKTARVVVDGQHGFPVVPGQVVRIGPSKNKARFVRLGSGFYERVRTKLTR
jgi:NAD+ kinase